MKKPHLLLVACLVGASVEGSRATASGPEPARNAAQHPAATLRIELFALPSEQPRAFRLDLENLGDKDLMVNLGKMLASGKVMPPDSVRLVLVGAWGKSNELCFFDRRYPGVAGRIGDLVALVRAGSKYSLRLSPNDYWCSKTREFPVALAAGEYRIHAVQRAGEAQHINLDTEDMKLMNYWNGILYSAPVSVNLRKWTPRVVSLHVVKHARTATLAKVI